MALFTFIAFLFLVYLAVIMLNVRYLQSSFNKYDVYNKTSLLIYKEAEKLLTSQALTGEKDTSVLDPADKEKMEIIIRENISFINDDNTRDFLDTNVKYVISYLNGSSPDFLLYFPVEYWAKSSKFISQVPDYLKGGNVNVETMLETNNINKREIQNLISHLNNTAIYINILIFSLLCIFVFLCFVWVISDKPIPKAQSFGKLITYIGISLLFLVWLFYTATENIILRQKGIPSFNRELVEIFYPVFSKPLIFLFSVFGILQLILGVILFNKNYKNELVSKGKVR